MALKLSAARMRPAGWGMWCPRTTTTGDLSAPCWIQMCRGQPVSKSSLSSSHFSHPPLSSSPISTSLHFAIPPDAHPFPIPQPTAPIRTSALLPPAPPHFPRPDPHRHAHHRPGQSAPCRLIQGRVRALERRAADRAFRGVEAGAAGQ